MPYIEITLYGRTVTAQEKERLVTGCVDVMKQALQSRPSNVRVAIHSWPEDSFFDGASLEAGATEDGRAEGVGG